MVATAKIVQIATAAEQEAKSQSDCVQSASLQFKELSMSKGNWQLPREFFEEAPSALVILDVQRLMLQRPDSACRSLLKDLTLAFGVDSLGACLFVFPPLEKVLPLEAMTTHQLSSAGFQVSRAILQFEETPVWGDVPYGVLLLAARPHSVKEGLDSLLMFLYVF